jgi:CheY-like chemotaxis protein
VEVKVGSGFVHIVDDNASFRKTMEGRLTQFGFDVRTYPSAQHLLDSLPRDDVPGCILLDVRLPGMSGPELQMRLIELGSADHLRYWLSRHTDDGENHQSGRGGFSGQASILGAASAIRRASHRASHLGAAPKARPRSCPISHRDVDSAGAASL